MIKISGINWRLDPGILNYNINQITIIKFSKVKLIIKYVLILFMNLANLLYNQLTGLINNSIDFCSASIITSSNTSPCCVSCKSQIQFHRFLSI